MGVTWGHQCHVLPVPTILGGGNGAEGCSQTLSVQQFLKKIFHFQGRKRGSGIILNRSKFVSSDKLIYGSSFTYPESVGMLVDLTRWG